MATTNMHWLAVLGSMMAAGVPIEGAWQPKDLEGVAPLYPDERSESEAHLRAAEARLERASTPGSRRKALRTVNAIRARLDALPPPQEG